MVPTDWKRRFTSLDSFSRSYSISMTRCYFTACPISYKSHSECSCCGAAPYNKTYSWLALPSVLHTYPAFYFFFRAFFISVKYNIIFLKSCQSPSPLGRIYSMRWRHESNLRIRILATWPKNRVLQEAPGINAGGACRKNWPYSSLYRPCGGTQHPKGNFPWHLVWYCRRAGCPRL